MSVLEVRGPMNKTRHGVARPQQKTGYRAGARGSTLVRSQLPNSAVAHLRVEHVGMQAVLPDEVLARRVLGQGAIVRDDRVDLSGRERQALVEMALGPDGDDRGHRGEVELRMVLHAPEALAALARSPSPGRGSRHWRPAARRRPAASRPRPRGCRAHRRRPACRRTAHGADRPRSGQMRRATPISRPSGLR